MPSQEFVGRIRESLADNERFEDFAYMFDALVDLRRPFTPNQRVSEEIVARILCVFLPDKPEKYMRAMRQFRLRFQGVSRAPDLQALFVNCVKNAAMIVRDLNDVVWTPSLYFRIPPGPGRPLPDWF